jgi:hypothetical protein
VIETTYYPGGFIASAPAKNRSQEYDSVASTFTTWNAAGAQTLQRALTAAEIARFASAAAASTLLQNDATVRSRAGQALTTNATFLAIANPTAAQVATQAKALTRECNGLIRLLLGQLDTITDT